MMEMNYIENAEQWREELRALQKIALSCGLSETVKWGKPVYDYDGRTVVLLQSFKANCCLLFLKGDSMPDPDGLLHRSEFKVNGGRRIEFTSLAEITSLEPKIRALIEEAKKH